MVELIPEDMDDLYVLYRLIVPGDRVESLTTRRKRSTDETRTDAGERITLRIGIKVKSVSFHEFDESLRVTGIIVAGREDLVPLGEHHTLRLKLNQSLKLIKDHWSEEDLSLLESSIQRARRAKLLIILLDDEQVIIAKVSEYSTQILVRFQSRITRKSSDVRQHHASKFAFFKEVTSAVTELLQREEPSLLLLAGPAFYPEDYLAYLKEHHVPWRSKLKLAKTSSATKAGLYELLSSGLPQQLVDELEVAKHTALLEEFMKRIGKDTGTVAYGLKEVQKAADLGAISDLLILDKLLKGLPLDSSGEDFDLDQLLSFRATIDQLLDQVRNTGGNIHVFSSFHPPGEQLEKLTGIAALLRFKLPDY